MTFPGVYGGHNWQPMSFSPLTNLVYVPGQERSSSYEPDPSYEYKPNANNTANRRGGAAFGKAPEPEGAENQPQVTTDGFLLAWDPVTQKERWRVTSPTVGGYTGGGTLATGGNLVFHGNAAYDATTGEKLWQTDMADRSVTPISYMLDGKQYISVIARPGPDARGVHVRIGWQRADATTAARKRRQRQSLRAAAGTSVKPPAGVLFFTLSPARARANLHSRQQLPDVQLRDRNYRLPLTESRACLWSLTEARVQSQAERAVFIPTCAPHGVRRALRRAEVVGANGPVRSAEARMQRIGESR